MNEEYAVRIFNFLGTYTNIENSSELSVQHQLFLRCWYKHEMNISTGWVTYWIKLAHHDAKFFINHSDSIVLYSSWRDLVIILNGLLNTKNPPMKCIEKLADIILNQIAKDLLEDEHNSEVGKVLPVTNKKYGAAYHYLLDFFNQTPQDWRKMVVSLRSFKGEPCKKTFNDEKHKLFTVSYNNIFIRWSKDSDLKTNANSFQNIYFLTTRNKKVFDIIALDTKIKTIDRFMTEVVKLYVE